MDEKPPVLIVHHDSDLAKTVAEILVHSYHVYVTKTPRRVDDFLMDNRVDLIIAGRDLAGMSALEWFRHLASAYPDVVRILLLSGQAQETEESALAEGLVHHLAFEPPEPVQLKQIIDGYFPSDQQIEELPATHSQSETKGEAVQNPEDDLSQSGSNTAGEFYRLNSREASSEQMGLDGHVLNRSVQVEPTPPVSALEPQSSGLDGQTNPDPYEVETVSREHYELLLQERQRLENKVRELSKCREDLELDKGELECEIDVLHARLLGRDEIVDESDHLRSEAQCEREELGRKMTNPGWEIEPSNDSRALLSPRSKSCSVQLALAETRQRTSRRYYQGQLEILEIKLKAGESQVQRLREELAKQRNLTAKAEQAFRAELREYQERYFAMKQSLAELERRYRMLKKEKMQIRERLTWLEAKWRPADDR